MSRILFRLGLIFCLTMLVGTAQAQLRGHGGPVRALAISPDGTQAISGSFDSSAIRWSLEKNQAERVLRFHDGAVNAVAFLADGGIATSGEDGRIALWTRGEQQPSTVLEGHGAPVVAHLLSLTPLRKIVRDYFMICDSYYAAIRTATPDRIEAIDMGRRGLHDEGSKLLQERLAGKVDMDFATARRLFTLICVLHWKG